MQCIMTSGSHVNRRVPVTRRCVVSSTVDSNSGSSSENDGIQRGTDGEEDSDTSLADVSISSRCLLYNVDHMVHLPCDTRLRGAV